MARARKSAGPGKAEDKEKGKTLGTRVSPETSDAFVARANLLGVSKGALLHRLIATELGTGAHETAAERRIRLFERLLQEMSYQSLAWENALAAGLNKETVERLLPTQDQTYRALLAALGQTKRGRRSPLADGEDGGIEELST